MRADKTEGRSKTSRKQRRKEETIRTSKLDSIGIDIFERD